MDAAWGLRIRALRTRRQISRQQLANSTGVTKDTINRMERGEVRNPRDNKRQQIADHFGVSEEYLMTGAPHAEGDPEYDILDDPLLSGHIEIKPKAPFSRSVVLSESKDGEDKARQLMEIAQKTNEKIKTLVFDGELELDQAVKTYALIYEAVKEASDLE